MSSPEQRKARKLIKAEQELVDKGVRHTLKTEEGRRFLWWLFEETDVLGNAFRPEQPQTTAFVLGEQNVGKKVLSRMEEVEPGSWLILRKEHLQRLIRQEEQSNE